MREEKAARQPSIWCDCCLVPAARNGRHGRKKDNSDGEQIHLYLENGFGNFAATCSGSRYLTGAHPHFKHLQQQLQVLYFNRSPKDESMEQSRRVSIAAISGSSCMQSNFCLKFQVVSGLVKLTGLTSFSQGRGPLQVHLSEGMCVTPDCMALLPKGSGDRVHSSAPVFIYVKNCMYQSYVEKIPALFSRKAECISTSYCRQ